jgi:hypothetical protein
MCSAPSAPLQLISCALTVPRLLPPHVSPRNNSCKWPVPRTPHPPHAAAAVTAPRRSLHGAQRADDLYQRADDLSLRFDLVRSSCFTAAYLARDAECQAQLMALGILPILLQLLASDFLPDRSAALSVLANLLELPECQEQLRVLKGLPLITANLAAATGSLVTNTPCVMVSHKVSELTFDVAHRHLACLALRNAAVPAPNKSAIKGQNKPASQLSSPALCLPRALTSAYRVRRAACARQHSQSWKL